MFSARCTTEVRCHRHVRCSRDVLLLLLLLAVCSCVVTENRGGETHWTGEVAQLAESGTIHKK